MLASSGTGNGAKRAAMSHRHGSVFPCRDPSSPPIRSRDSFSLSLALCLGLFLEFTLALHSCKCMRVHAIIHAFKIAPAHTHILPAEARPSCVARPRSSSSIFFFLSSSCIPVFDQRACNLFWLRWWGERRRGCLQQPSSAAMTPPPPLHFPPSGIMLYNHSPSASTK